MGSAMLPAVCGAYQKSARVGHSAIIAEPLTGLCLKGAEAFAFRLPVSLALPLAFRLALGLGGAFDHVLLAGPADIFSSLDSAKFGTSWLHQAFAELDHFLDARRPVEAAKTPRLLGRVHQDVYRVFGDVLAHSLPERFWILDGGRFLNPGL